MIRYSRSDCEKGRSERMVWEKLGESSVVLSMSVGCAGDLLFINQSVRGQAASYCLRESNTPKQGRILSESAQVML